MHTLCSRDVTGETLGAVLAARQRTVTCTLAVRWCALNLTSWLLIEIDIITSKSFQGTCLPISEPTMWLITPCGCLSPSHHCLVNCFLLHQLCAAPSTGKHVQTIDVSSQFPWRCPAHLIITCKLFHKIHIANCVIGCLPGNWFAPNVPNLENKTAAGAMRWMVGTNECWTQLMTPLGSLFVLCCVAALIPWPCQLKNLTTHFLLHAKNEQEF